LLLLGQTVIDIKSRSHREYLTLTDNIIVLYRFFNTTTRSDLIGRL